MTDEGGTSCRRRCRFLGAKPGASKGEGRGFEGRRCRLRRPDVGASSQGALFFFKKEGEKFGNMQGIV